MLLPAAAAAILIGCVMQVPLAGTVEENRPPYVDLGKVSFSELTYVTVQPGQKTAFDIPEVEDPDVEDTLHIRWYLQATDPPDDEETELRYRTQSPTGTVVRHTGWSVEVDPCRHGLPEGLKRARLWARIRDREFPKPVPEGDEVPEDEGKEVEVRWELVLEGVCE